MDAFFSILGIIFVTLLIAAALTFGITIILFFLGVAFLTAFLIMLREYWYRWRFVHRASKHEKEAQGVIEADYTDITHSKDK